MKALQFANLPLRRKIQAVILLTAAVLTAVMLAGAQAVQAVNSRLLPPTFVPAGWRTRFPPLRTSVT